MFCTTCQRNALESKRFQSFPRSSPAFAAFQRPSTTFPLACSAVGGKLACAMRARKLYSRDLTRSVHPPSSFRGVVSTPVLRGSRGYGSEMYVGAHNSTSLFTSAAGTSSCAPSHASALAVSFAPRQQHQQRSPGEIRSAGSTVPSSVNDQVFSAIQVNTPLPMDVPG